MLTELCQELQNWFDRNQPKVYGTFTIQDGALTSDFLQDGQYFRIIGSVFNDGVWKYGTDTLTDETFDGAVWGMAIPKAFLALNDEIDAWIAAYGERSTNPYSSESFGGYSYSKAGSSASGADLSTWQGAFRSRMNAWRKL